MKQLDFVAFYQRTWIDALSFSSSGDKSVTDTLVSSVPYFAAGIIFPSSKTICLTLTWKKRDKQSRDRQSTTAEAKFGQGPGSGPWQVFCSGISTSSRDTFFPFLLNFLQRPFNEEYFFDYFINETIMRLTWKKKKYCTSFFKNQEL